MIDTYWRAITRARWITVATGRGVYDANEVIQPGYLVDEIGFFQLTDGVYDGTTVITPPTFDTWWSVNLRIHGQKFLEDNDTVFTGETPTQPWRFIRSKIVRFVREQSTTINLPFRGDTVRAYQFGTGVNRIQLLDPRDITFPRRQFLGGMFL
jgi:hypothetical protein